MITLQCFQRQKAVIMINDEVPFRDAIGPHQSTDISPAVGMRETDRIQERISCQVIREKVQPTMIWSIVSTSRSHNTHLGGPSTSQPVYIQQWSWEANHRKNFTLGGPQDFQIGFQGQT